MQSKVRYAADTYKLTTIARLTLNLSPYCFGSSSTDVYVYAIAYLYNAINSLSFSLCSDCWHCGAYVWQLTLPSCQGLHIPMSPACTLVIHVTSSSSSRLSSNSIDNESEHHVTRVPVVCVYVLLYRSHRACLTIAT
jgi:hypothetical protein